MAGMENRMAALVIVGAPAGERGIAGPAGRVALRVRPGSDRMAARVSEGVALPDAIN
ncbi:hypothetical protein GCM10017688_06010 [Streptomyces ramulosus]